MTRNIRLRQMFFGLAMAAIGLSAQITSAQTIVTVQDGSFETPLVDWSSAWGFIDPVWNPNPNLQFNRASTDNFFTSTPDGGALVRLDGKCGWYNNHSESECRRQRERQPFVDTFRWERWD